jgi:hypothetical protein
LWLGLGSLNPKFDHENILEISSSIVGMLFMVLALSYIGVMLMLGNRPIYIHLNGKIFFKSIGGLEFPICYSVIFIITWAIVHIALRLGIRSLNSRDF